MSEGSGPREFDVPDDWEFPRLGRRVVPDGAGVESSDEHETATGYDTDAGDLLAAGVRLVRSAVTGAEPVWRLRVAADTSMFPAVGRGVPPEVRDLLVGVRAGAALRPRERVVIERTIHRVVGADHAERGTITVEQQTIAEPSADGASVEISPERRVVVAGWDGPFVDAAVRRLTKSGASELAAPRVPEPRTVGDAVSAYIAHQQAAIVDADLALRFGQDAVHRFRVAIRRLRSAVKVVDVSDPEAAGALESELRWLAEVLGEVRDRQVLRAHLLADPDPDPVLASAYGHVAAVLDDEEARAKDALTRAMRGRRYLALLRTLRTWRQAPPFTADADRPVERLRTYTRKASRTLDRKLAKAHAANDGSTEQLHAARKAAKRARYVADLAGPAAGKHGPRIAHHAKSLQTRLGDHQDCVLAANLLERAARMAPTGAAFGCGILWAREQARATEAARAAQADQ